MPFMMTTERHPKRIGTHCPITSKIRTKTEIVIAGNMMTKAKVAIIVREMAVILKGTRDHRLLTANRITEAVAGRMIDIENRPMSEAIELTMIGRRANKGISIVKKEIGQKGRVGIRGEQELGRTVGREVTEKGEIEIAEADQGIELKETEGMEEVIEIDLKEIAEVDQKKRIGVLIITTEDGTNLPTKTKRKTIDLKKCMSG